jgi:aspartyl-tRNA(Asn)/glutamyl-tRNA(Gln) amidotransferase subunit A
VPAELLAFLGTERFAVNLDLIDPVVRARVSQALELKATEYIGLLRRHRSVVESARKRIQEIDGWITPTSPVLPSPVNDCDTVEAAIAWNKRSLRNTQPINYLGQCAVSIPVHREGELPVGLQVICAPGEDPKLLSMAVEIEGALGLGPRPDLSGWGP